MRPSQVATELRKIAAAIEASKTPDKARVASAIKGLVKKIAGNLFTPNVVKIREYISQKDKSFDIIDGYFEFTLHDGRKCTFDGRLDKNNTDGVFTCDGVEISDERWGDSQTLGFLGDEFSHHYLDSLLCDIIETSENSG